MEKAGRRCLQQRRPYLGIEQCTALVERTGPQFGGIDVLVNKAAAKTKNEGLDDIDDDEMQAFALYVFAMLPLAKAAKPHMKTGLRS